MSDPFVLAAAVVMSFVLVFGGLALGVLLSMREDRRESKRWEK